jgi:Flp pilus assembly protein TadD
MCGMGKKVLLLGGAIMAVNSAYLASFSDPTLAYVFNVLLHVGVGFLFIAGLVWLHATDRRWGALSLALLSGGLGMYLAIFAATRDHRWALWSHIGASVLVLALLAGTMASKQFAWTWKRYAGLLAACLILPFGVAAYHRVLPNAADHIRNVPPPTSMDGEGDGPRGPFFPSSASTNTGTPIPSNFFMDSESCIECHKDIYDQWKGSAHHFGSFNNQFYRKSIEYMQEVAGIRSSKWCAGCHDHALLFSGMFDKPIAETLQTPEAQVGLGCMSCHAIVEVHTTMGQGGFRIEYPALHNLAVSKNPFIRGVAKFVTRAAPQAHRRIFLKPFMVAESSEFCSTCHKVHLDVPVNRYRWIRGFNDYDNWQASGVSGQGARSFYYPKESSTCTGCHMPMVKSADFGNRDGMVHSHRFPAANTALPAVNGDDAQKKATNDFLRSGFLTVDVFGVVPESAASRAVAQQRAAGGENAPRLSTTFAVGEESLTGGGVLREAAPVVGPIDHVQPVVRPGDSIGVEVVVRTRKIGHFFPGGTVDAFDVWVELEARDDSGRVVYHSGFIEDNGNGSGNGPVDRGAHFYKSFLLDAHGNPINKRNAYAARSVLYTRLIPPGAADTVHYRLTVPRDLRGNLHLTARVNYRKFAWFYTQFSYAGVPGPGYMTPNFDDREVKFTGDTSGVSGTVKQIPNLPVTVIAEAKATLNVGPQPSAGTGQALKEDRERWNDYGIGLLLQGDLKAAEAAFKKVTDLDPAYADGWLNVARCLVQEGETEAAAPWIEQALERQPKLARAHFFNALVLKAAGSYDPALAELEQVLAQYPRDRVVLNQKGRILFLKREYAAAVAALKGVLGVDPEDLQAHYNLMLAYRGLGDAASADREEKLYMRFKAEESSQAITGDYRRIHPEDNNERQPIHEHVASVVDIDKTKGRPQAGQRASKAISRNDRSGSR